MVPGYTSSATLYSSDVSTVERCRRTADGQSVVIKSHVRGRGIPVTLAARLRYEYRILQRLQEFNARHVIRAIGLHDTPTLVALILEDSGGRALNELQREARLSVQEIMGIAVQVSMALLDIHRARVVHKDLNPANILTNRATGAVQVIDLGIAAAVRQELQTVDNLSAFTGTLPYASPEQTGKSNRLLDYRSDFYSLGVTLYELLAGHLPFPFADSTRLARAILTEVPAPLDTTQVPAPFADIVLRLMSKSPDRRYQSATSLHHDFQRCLDDYTQTGAVQPFTLGRDDHSEIFEISQSLYGRAADTEKLLAAYQRATTQKRREFVFVAGASGMGKSALVNELQAALLGDNGLFMAGKYDQLLRHIPFSAFGQAVAGLVRRISMSDEANVAQWRRLLQHAMGAVGQALVDIAPALETLVGEQKPMPQLGPRETENRLLMLLQRFMRDLTETRPGVLFLDDLQWADAGTLRFLQDLGNDTTSGAGLVVIGAYRDNEAAENPALLQLIAALDSQNASVTKVQVTPLQLHDVADLLADTTHQNAAACQELAALLLRKTAGNPFYLRTFLQDLWDQQLITYEPHERHWIWDFAAVSQATVAENVIDLITRRLAALPAPIQKILGVAACFGGEFSVEALASVTEEIPVVVAERLQEALQGDVLVPLGNDYRYAADAGGDCAYAFVHDKVQQAAYAAFDPQLAIQTHERIGKQLLAHRDQATGADWSFRTVDHLNRAISLLRTPVERLELAQLNYTAACEARSAMAYAAALKYLQVSRQLLPEGEAAWAEHYTLTRQVTLELASSAFLSAQHDAATVYLDEALKHSRSPEEMAHVQHQRMLALSARSRYQEALLAGSQALSYLGFHLEVAPSRLPVLRALLRVRMALIGTNVRSLAGRPACTDARISQQIRILADTAMPAYFHNANAFAKVSLSLCYLTIRHGTSPYSGYAYGAYVTMLAVFSQFKHLLDFIYVCEECLRRNPDSLMRGSALFVKSAFADNMRLPPDQLIVALDTAHLQALEGGDPLYAAWSIVIRNTTVCRLSLNSYLDLASQHERFVTAHNHSATMLMRANTQMARCLTGQTRAPTRYDDDHFSQEEFEASLRINPAGPAASWYYTSCMMVCWINRSIPNALKYMRCAVAENVVTKASEPFTFCFFACLTLLEDAAKRGARSVVDRGLFKRLKKKLSVAHWPHLTQSVGLLQVVDGATAALLGNRNKAALLFEQGARNAATFGYLSFAAAAHEVAGRHFLEGEINSAGNAYNYIVAAHDAYAAWGAAGKARALRMEFPALFPAPISVQTTAKTHPGSTTSETGQTALRADLPALLQACENLLQDQPPAETARLSVNSLVKCANATRAVLLGIDQGAAVVLASSDESEDYPHDVVQYVVRSREPLVLDAANPAHSRLTHDPYLLRVNPSAVSCLPIVQRGSLSGVVYLENQYVSEIFSAANLQVVQVLAASTALALENVQLRTAMQAVLERQTATLRADHAHALERTRVSTELQIAGGVAHELRNALGGSKFLLESLALSGQQQSLTEIADKLAATGSPLANDLRDVLNDSAPFQDVVSLAQAGILRAGLVVDRVSEYADVNTLQPGVTESPLAPAIEQALRNLQRAIEQSGISVAVDVPKTLRVGVPADHLGSIVLQIVKNAVEAIAEVPQGIDRTLVISARAQDHAVRLMVSDTGVGISQAAAASVFSLFYSTKGAKGMGIGLALCRKLVDKYAGSIAFKPQPRGGTEFTVTLPHWDGPLQ